ncbi:hypothetical protein LCGC14_2130350 [marine sediment metagenome]|uniref:Uncharacterized protein n=1 Tax=marine sediment metagenome TaxID=412755 RepID=A0A0F9E1P5_9ZZZZ
MTIKKNIYGYLVISDIKNGYRIEKKYLYYTKKEAIKLFRKAIKKGRLVIN